MNIPTRRFLLGTQKDSETIVRMTRAMLLELSKYGGDNINLSSDIWEWFADEVSRNCASPDHFNVFAVDAFSQTITGVLSAKLEMPEALFSGRNRLHISAVYTVPSERNQGIAAQLLQHAFDWGRARNAHEAKLNVLSANPARLLYEKLGFQEREVLMTKPLK